MMSFSRNDLQPLCLFTHSQKINFNRLQQTTTFCSLTERGNVNSLMPLLKQIFLFRPLIQFYFFILFVYLQHLHCLHLPIISTDHQQQVNSQQVVIPDIPVLQLGQDQPPAENLQLLLESR